MLSRHLRLWTWCIAPGHITSDTGDSGGMSMTPTLLLEAFGQLASDMAAIGTKEEDLYSVFRARAELMGWSSTDPHPTRLWGLEEAELTDGSTNSDPAGGLSVFCRCSAPLWACHVDGNAGGDLEHGSPCSLKCGSPFGDQLVPPDSDDARHGPHRLGSCVAWGAYGPAGCKPPRVEPRRGRVWAVGRCTGTAPNPDVRRDVVCLR